MPDKPMAAPGLTPDDDLFRKQADLKVAQDQIAKLNQTVSSLQDDIKALSQKAAEIRQATAGYDTVQKSMQKELDDDKSRIKKLSDIAQAVLKDTTEKIDFSVTDFDKDLQDGDAVVGKPSDTANTAAAESSDADADVQKKQAIYDGLKNGTAKDTPKFNHTALSDLAGLLTAMAKAEAQTDFVAVYFLATEAKKKADAITILSPDGYTQKLKAAQSDLEAAKTIAKSKKKAADDAVAAYAAAKQAQQSRWQSRISDLLAELRDMVRKAA